MPNEHFVTVVFVNDLVDSVYTDEAEADAFVTARNQAARASGRPLIRHWRAMTYRLYRPGDERP